MAGQVDHDPIALVSRALVGWSGEAWIVGGAIRDRLLGKPVTDVDLAVRGDAREAARTVHGALGGDIFSLSDRFGTWRMHAPQGFQVDLTELRGDSIEADLAKRDFTINAIAQPVASSELIDPYDGAGDLGRRTLRMVSETALTDDPLRLLRLARLAATLELKIEATTKLAAERHAKLVIEPAAERVFAELRGIVAGQRAIAGIELLDDLGLLALVLPEITALQGVEQTKYHHKDVYAHTLEVLERTIELERSGYAAFGASADRLVQIMSEPLADELTRAGALRWAALLHDIAKPQTRRVFDNGRVGFPGHDREGVQVVRAIGRRLHASERFIQFVAQLTQEHMRLGFLVREQPLSRRDLHRYLVATEPVEVEVELLSVADRLSTRGHKHELSIPPHLELAEEVMAEAIEFRDHPPTPLVRGDQLAAALGIEPGPRLGELLAEIAEAQFAGEVSTSEGAIAAARAAL